MNELAYERKEEAKSTNSADDDDDVINVAKLKTYFTRLRVQNRCRWDLGRTWTPLGHSHTRFRTFVPDNSVF